MKKKKIANNEDSFQDYLILTISADMEDYHLAFLLNDHLSIKLFKTADLKMMESGSTSNIFSAYYFHHDCHSEYFLLKNVSGQGTIISQFFLIVKGFSNEQMNRDLISRIEKIDKIIEIEHIIVSESANDKRTKKNVVFFKHLLNDLEFHILDMQRVANEKKISLKVEKPLRPKKLY
jgi:hypothetical protein